MKSNCISAAWNELKQSAHKDLEWFSIKLSLVLVVDIFLVHTLYSRTSQPFPVGICTIIDCVYFVTPPMNYIITVLLIGLSMLYVLEMEMLLCTFFIFCFIVIFMSLEESNGNPAENGILSLIFFAQFLAYLIHAFNPTSKLADNRLQYTAQFFAAAYTLSAISKLSTSGVAWFTTDASKFPLEVMRVFYSNYVTYGNIQNYMNGIFISDFMLTHLLLTKLMLFFALLTESFAFMLMMNRKISFYYAILLLTVHIGIYLTMGIFFATFILPLIAFFINPLYWVLNLISGYRQTSGIIFMKNKRNLFHYFLMR